MPTSRLRGVGVLQITDPHLFASADGELLGVRTTTSLHAVLALARSDGLAPDVVLATGDVSQDGSPESYQRFRHIVAEYFAAPVYWLAGNHDLTAPMQAASVTGNAGNRSVAFGDWQLLLLDSHADDVVEGRLADSELAFLRDAIATHAQRHILVAVHHPPVPVGSAWIDTQMIANASAFWDIVDQADSVRAVIFGHVHQNYARNHGGVRVLGTPSTCFQFRPNTRDFALDAQRQPGYRWLRLTPAGTVATHVRRVARGVTRPLRRASGY